MSGTASNGPIFVSRRLQLTYNQKTRHLPIQKNVRFISVVVLVSYEKHKICERFQ